jgi:poly-gamma-glutamate synthesis protein (capsule biosynthesis protein)
MKKHIQIIGLLFLILITLGAYMSHENTLSNSAIIGFMGDVMIGRMVNETIETTDYTYPWGNTLPILQKADLRIINLETTLTTHTQKNPKVFNFKAFPDRVQTLQAAHIDIANLANNHSLDFKEAGLIETIATLDSAHIAHVGAGMNIQEAYSPTIITKNNIKIGIIGCTDNEPKWKATDNKPGTNYIEIGNISDLSTIKTHITALRDIVDIIIVTIHWGPNMQQRPSQEFIECAHAIIDAGVDIIHGHSSHIFQGVEVYKNKIILYDTGDFIDDYAIDPILRNDQSIFFAVTVTKNGPQSLKLTPVIINNMRVNIAEGSNKQEIIERIQKLSQEFNTTVSNDGVVQISQEK